MTKYFTQQTLFDIGLQPNSIIQSVMTLANACLGIGQSLGFTYRNNVTMSLSFCPNPALLETVFVSWQMDVYWQEKYQKTILSNTKKAAYFLHWTSKIKPVQLMSYSQKKEYQMLNELCAFRVACCLINVDPNKMDKKHLQDILYLLFYCDSSAEALFPVLSPLPLLYPKLYDN